MNYKLIKSELTGQINGVFYIQDGVSVSIPFDPANTDYQAYLKWIEAGNQPLPADE